MVGRSDVARRLDRFGSGHAHILPRCFPAGVLPGASADAENAAVVLEPGEQRGRAEIVRETELLQAQHAGGHARQHRRPLLDLAADARVHFDKGFGGLAQQALGGRVRLPRPGSDLDTNRKPLSRRATPNHGGRPSGLQW